MEGMQVDMETAQIVGKDHPVKVGVEVGEAAKKGSVMVGGATEEGLGDMPRLVGSDKVTLFDNAVMDKIGYSQDNIPCGEEDNIAVIIVVDHKRRRMGSERT